jgi:ABC-type Na+ transport system ATPase subunit NatA
MSSHNMPEVERLCDFIIIMSFGRVVAMGQPRELIERYQSENLDEVFIHLARAEQLERADEFARETIAGGSAVERAAPKS